MRSCCIDPLAYMMSSGCAPLPRARVNGNGLGMTSIQFLFLKAASCTSGRSSIYRAPNMVEPRRTLVAPLQWRVSLPVVCEFCVLALFSRTWRSLAQNRPTCPWTAPAPAPAIASVKVKCNAGFGLWLQVHFEVVESLIGCGAAGDLPAACSARRRDLAPAGGVSHAGASVCDLQTCRRRVKHSGFGE